MEIKGLSEKEEYSNKLESQIQVINHILRMDSGAVVSTEQEKQLRGLKAEAETILKKLKNDEFEIAVVGLEKAGKSTFANALMENNLLPVKDLRCTFTSTQIEYSGDDQDDSAAVSFYTIEEFDQDFKDKLCKLGFPNYERYSFDTLDENVYITIYERDVADDKKKAYGDSIHEDILAIIRNVRSLSKLLGCPDIAITADKIYSGELTPYITDEAKAHAIKRVIIRSKKLSEMKNAIIFDVPGFNSPTELHKIQTRERMKAADAIIVVASGISPSLTGESLKILRESDDEGNPLSDKLFVFANKIEGARDIAVNIQDTYKEWCGKGFVSSSNKHRIIFGSALAHLQSKGLDHDSRTLRDFKEREDQMPDGDGIEAMRCKLTEYNHTERFEVLKRRINRINANIMKAFHNIRKMHGEGDAERSYGSAHMALATEFCRNMPREAEKALLELKKEIRSYILGKRPLSEKITSYISPNITKERYHISDEMIEEVKNQTPYTSIFEDTARIEAKIRELKFIEMYDDFLKDVINIADKFHFSYSAQILDTILEAMNVKDDSPYYEDLKTLLKSKISPYRGELMTSENGTGIYYQSLIERFSRDIYEVLITSQYNAERLRKFYASVDNFFSMSVFYKKSDCDDDLSYIGIAPQDQPLCRMLLFHYCLNCSDRLQLLSDDLARITGVGEMPTEIWRYVEEAFFAVNGLTEEIINAVAKKFVNVVDKTNDFRINLLKNVLLTIIESDKPCGIADRESFQRYYEQYHSSIRGGKQYSVDDFRSEFDNDIEILQDVLMTAFVRAINLEKPFVARETKSIDDMIKYIRESPDFTLFLTENFWKIRYEETKRLDKQHREHEQNAAIISEINGILDTLGN